MSSRSALKPISQINVVPYIDVMLVLLVIFMITAPLMNPGQIDLPSVGKSLAPPIAPLVVVIKKDNTLALRDLSKSDYEQDVSRTELVELLKQKQDTERGSISGHFCRQKCALRRSDQCDGRTEAAANQKGRAAGTNQEPMSTLAYSYPEPYKLPAGVLALAVHAAFFALLYFGVNWHNDQPQGMEVDIWSDLPSPQVEPVIVVPPPPPPMPLVEPVKPIQMPKLAEPVEPPKADIEMAVKKKTESKIAETREAC